MNQWENSYSIQTLGLNFAGKTRLPFPEEQRSYKPANAYAFDQLRKKKKNKFACVEVLLPSQPTGVMSSPRGWLYI